MMDYTPQLKKILPQWIKVESGGNPRAVSSAGARGLLQLMPDTAKRFGVSDPFDQQQNLAAALKYGNFLMNRYGGDLPTALMAYHAGEGNVDNYLAGKKSGVGALTKAYPKKILGQLEEAGFKSMQQRPQPTDTRFPIQLIPGVDPQSPVVEHNPNMRDKIMPVQEQPVSGHLVDFKKSQKDINRSKLLAETLQKSVNWGDPYAQISGRAIAQNPLAVLANALTQGMANRGVIDAQSAQDDLETQKAQALQDMMAGGNVDMKQLAASGFLAPEDLAKGLMQKQQQAEYNAVYGDNGEIMAFDKLTGKVVPTGQKSALYAPNSVYNRSLANSAGKGVEMTDDQGRPYYVPQGQTNPAFGNYGQRFDQPTSLMPVPNSAPLQPQPGGVVKGASPVELKRKEAEVLIAPKVQEAQAVGSVKNAQEVDLAKEKAQIENAAKIDELKSTDTYKKSKSANEAMDAINQAKKLLPGATESGLGAIRDAAGNMLGISTPAADKAAQLEVLGGVLTAKVPRMEGPQSDADRKSYEAQAGKVGDRTIPVSQRLAALQEVERIHKKYAAQTGGGATESFEQPPKIIRYDAQGNRIQ